MSASWKFYRFDYERYLALRLELQAADDPDAFMPLSINDVTEAVIDALNFGEIDAEHARNTFVLTLCCLGDPLPLDPGLLRMVARLAKTRGTEDLGELLETLLGGAMNLEPWLISTQGAPGAFQGFLTPAQTLTLHETYGDVFRTGGKGRKRRRKGGLVGNVGAFLRQLLVLELKPEESLALLGDLIADAAKRNEGVAVTAS